MVPFETLGQALRYLRLRQQKKQYEIADAAGITRAMLCAYERGSREPSVTSLGKILDALDADLVTLQQAMGAMAVIRQDPAAPPAPPMDSAPARVGPTDHGWDPMRLLGDGIPLDPEEARAIEQIFAGFRRWLRFVHRETRQVLGGAVVSG